MIPEQHREKVDGALLGAFGANGVSGIQPVGGGASGALTYRVETGEGDFLLRVETITGPMRNPFQYECMQIAADAGIAPPIRHLDADAGVVVLPFIEHRPLADYAGGPAALAADTASLLARLHATRLFPSRGDHLDNLARMLGYLGSSGRVAPGLLDRHEEGFERIRAAYPWEPASFVSAHNDPNQFNLLHDGERLWLIDWETANRNDPFIDVATVLGWLAPTPDLRDIVLRSWLGREPTALDRAKATLVTALVQLFAGCILLTIVVDPANPTHSDLTPMSPAEFGTRIASGELVAGTPATTHAYAKIVLAAFVDGLGTPAIEDALAVAAAG